MARNYRKEYLRDHAAKGDKDNRVDRNRARRKALRDGLVSKGDSKEIDHKVPLSKGGSGGDGNTRVVSRATNRKKAARRYVYKPGGKK